MIYGNIPMMIFILAAGYLFTVYLLLALAKRTGKNSDVANVGETGDKKSQSLTTKVTEAVNSQ
jgi:hypothetical protein